MMLGLCPMVYSAWEFHLNYEDSNLYHLHTFPDVSAATNSPISSTIAHAAGLVKEFLIEPSACQVS
jgi:hypothetical protein